MSMEEERETEAEEQTWTRETVPKVLRIVSTRLSQRDLVSLLLVSPWLHRTLVSYSSLWLVLDLREMNNAGNRLVAALSLPRYRHLRQINLEFAQDIEDKHFELLKGKCSDSLQNLESLNLNGCQKISDKGIDATTSSCTNLSIFSIYWNVRVTDIGLEHLVRNCKHIVDLNLSGCKLIITCTIIAEIVLSACHRRLVENVSDKSLDLIAVNYPELEILNLTRCIKLTDSGLQRILLRCSSLKSLNLYALSGFSDESYKSLSLLANLKFLDLCGAQNLSDEGLFSIAKCQNMVSLNLTWCVRVTDVGVKAIAQGCTALEFLSLFGIVGVTDNCLEALSRHCTKTITTLDVNGCVGIKRRSREELLQLFPYLKCFKVHS